MRKLGKQNNYLLIAIVYLAGIFMGAIDTGIVTPARTLIQNNLLVGDKTGIWMITIYTLAYAASIPVMGKLADKLGRKTIYLISIFLFGLGSLFCGLSQSFGSFGVLLGARVVQAIGGGGIVPVATAEFGTTFPKEKRGMALGLVGGVYGIANILGASAGSAILDLFGKNNWQFIFYVNLPITLFILIAGFFSLPNTKSENVKKNDLMGISILTAMVLSLLYGLRNIDFFSFKASFLSSSVYPFLIAFIVLLPVFILTERKAEDPVINLSYFKNVKIIITLALSFVTGIVMMGMIFVPQFSENALKVSSGNGGYFVIILGVFAGLGAPVSGKLIDKFGPKLILGFGFLVSVVGSLFLVLVAANSPNAFNVTLSLILIGIGMGFTLGTPLNYMMLENTRKEESNSALATLSLIRSIGTAIAPAIMIGFISHAGIAVQTNVMALLPKEVKISSLPYAKELTDQINKLKTDPATKDKFTKLNFPDLTAMEKIEINMSANSGVVIPAELLERMKSSDVTTIVDNTKVFAEEMFAQMTPPIIAKIQGGIQSGITGMAESQIGMEKSIAQLQQGADGIGAGIRGMESAVSSQKSALKQLELIYQMMSQAGAKAQGMPVAAVGVSLIDSIPPNINNQIPQNVLAELKTINSPKELEGKIIGLKMAIAALNSKIETSKKSQSDMLSAMASIKIGQAQMSDTIRKMTVLKDAIPPAFESAKTNYLAQIDSQKDVLEGEFQKTLNGGFKQVYLTTAIASAAALLILLFYRKKKESASV